jgi:hypothetical protein
MTRGHIDENKAAGKDLGNFVGMLHTGFAAHFRAGSSSTCSVNLLKLEAVS